MNLFDQLVKIPWLAYLVFSYCVIYGWRARHPRIISYYRLFIVPLLLSIWTLYSIFVRYSLSWGHLSAWIIADALGSWIGWVSSCHLPIEADKRKKLIKVPGTRSMLLWILLIFFFRYYFGFIHIFHPESLKNPFYTYPDLIVSALLIGFLLGRGLHYSFAYKQAPHTDLHRSIKM